MAAQRGVIGYCRVSTDDQAQGGHSLPAQRSRIEAYAQAQGSKVLAVYADEGISGKTVSKRPELQKALDHACREKAVFVVYSLSRASRSIRDCIEIMEKLGAKGAEIVSLTEAIDTTTPMGRAVFGIVAVFAQLERELVSERTKGVMSSLRQEGRRTSRYPPFGWRHTRDGRCVAVPEEQEALNQMRLWRDIDGVTYQEIADRLNAMGVKTKRGSSWERGGVKRCLDRASARAS